MTGINKKAYETPTLTVVIFKSEQGYAASGELEILRMQLDDEVRILEQRSETGGFFGDNSDGNEDTWF